MRGLYIEGLMEDLSSRLAWRIHCHMQEQKATQEHLFSNMQQAPCQRPDQVLLSELQIDFWPEPQGSFFILQGQLFLLLDRGEY